MKANKSSIFQNVLFTLIALCTVAMVTLMAFQFILGNDELETVKAELDSCKDKIESQEKALSEAEKQIAAYAEELKSMESKQEKTYSVSSTKEYAAWVTAQSAVEPYDLYYDLQYAYEQLVELDSDYMIGTEKYKAALNLLVPKKRQEDMSSYMGKLKRYFGTSDISTVRDRFIDDLVSAKLLTAKGDSYYSWDRTTLTTNNVVNKLNLTQDVANALIGLLNTMDWGV